MKLLIAAAVFLAAAPAFAADATLVKISGPVFYRAAGAAKFAPARGGEEMIAGDSVKTGAGGIAHVALGSRGAVLIRENSLFTLEGTPRRAWLDFARGEFLVGLRRTLARGESFRVSTPAAVAAVRGTLFWGKSDEKKTTTFAGFGHRVSVTAQGKTVTLDAGQTVTVAFGEAPSQPKPHDIPVSYTKNFAIDGSLQDLETLVDMPKAAAPDAPAGK
jgi:hypothetical protein